MPPPYTILRSQQPPPSPLIDRFSATATASHFNASRYSSLQKYKSHYGWGQSNGLDKPLAVQTIWMTAIACAIGAVILSCILYCCWKRGGPRPTYYEEAIRSQRQGVRGRRMKLGHYAQHSPYRIASAHGVDPIIAAVDDKLEHPERVRTRSSSSYFEQQETHGGEQRRFI
ncbi:hypothetical protein F5Y03DRAFT_140876 [Xylaria venustula]|nr:hypothetical protein F5Y03DRAFT_140876 [Xylaria venustula]